MHEGPVHAILASAQEEPQPRETCTDRIEKRAARPAVRKCYTNDGHDATEGSQGRTAGEVARYGRVKGTTFGGVSHLQVCRTWSTSQLGPPPTWLAGVWGPCSRGSAEVTTCCFRSPLGARNESRGEIALPDELNMAIKKHNGTNVAALSRPAP